MSPDSSSTINKNKQLWNDVSVETILSAAIRGLEPQIAIRFQILICIPSEYFLIASLKKERVELFFPLDLRVYRLGLILMAGNMESSNIIIHL